MNGREKSDSAIVAAKSTNEAERSGSEPMEPRACPREGGGRRPRGRRSRKARSGHRAGPTRHRRGNAYGKLQGATGRRGSPRCCITSRSRAWKGRSARWPRTLRPESTAWRGGTTK